MNIIRLGGGGASAVLTTKTITQNGVYNASADNADGYSSVDVDVQGATPLNTVKFFSGKITNTTGEIVADNDYLYTDFIPLPNGELTFDMGLNSTQVYAGLTIYDSAGVYANYWNPNSRHRLVDFTQYYAQGARFFRLSFPVANIHYVYAHDWENDLMYCTDEPIWITNGAMSEKYINISDFDFYFRRNTTVPTVTKISDVEFALSFQDQNASGYEICSFGVTLPKGNYIAEIYATVDKNTGISNQYLWGVYSSNTGAGAEINTADPKNAYSTYIPFDRTDTNEHYYEIPVKMLSDGTGYICFATSDDNGQNATISVSSLKIRTAEAIVKGVDYIESWIIKSQNSGTSIPTITTHVVYNETGAIESFDVQQNAGNATITAGDISTYIGDASSYKWRVTANASMKYKIVDIVNGTIGTLKTASSGDVLINDGVISAPYCVEIRRYS